MADAVSEFFYSCSGKQTDGKDEAKSAKSWSSKKKHADQIKIKKLYADDYNKTGRIEESKRNSV